MFDRILIANRGEIACRVIQTAQRMGVSCVAVYSDADRAARHVLMADEAVHIGSAAPAESYLHADRIIEAAKATGAQAIHPGYGFLSENPDFVEAVEAAGLTFIGPSADAIRAMGLKDAAKALMQEAGVPVVPGYHGDIQDDAHLAEEADKIGYPVLVKAVAGGGGKGMRLVEAPDAFATALAAARGEARTAFGNDAVLIEKFVGKPRHIEVQIFGDGMSAVHLFERDCSLQRRHQKVIEEAPAPGLTEAMRATMGAAAVRAAEAIGYAGAGTVEFIVDSAEGLREDSFFFMEMNTRLQVEHPVTEAITGVDLVEWQLRVASGEGLPMTQEELSITGHAFEARLYAEDVPKGFLPATGRLSHVVFPKHIRADTGVSSGDEISPFYDPMIAKLVSHGPTRETALRELSSGLKACQVAGTVTNLAFLGALTEHAGFASGDVDTGLIGRDLDSLVHVPKVTPEDVALAVLAADGLLERSEPDTGFALWAPLWRTVGLRYDDTEITAKVASLSADAHDVALDEGLVSARRVGGHWMVNDRRAPATAGTATHVTVFRDYGITFERVDPLARATTADDTGNAITAPMPGLVKLMAASVGQQVQKGERLAVLEAMKMEHALLAGTDGIVAAILVEEGAQVAAGAPMILLEDPT
ncbi:MAG: biotin carboxylase N-terminal domain-containing protein [Pseudomonadota bacterium]